MSWIDCGVLLYGTCVMFSPNVFFMYSPDRCSAVPAPGDENVIGFGLSLANLISSGTVLTGMPD